MFLGVEMNCKCNELKIWLKKEINHLEEIKKELSFGSTLHQVLDAKILSYSIVLEGLS